MNWDSTRLATGGADFTVRLWDVETGATINTISEDAGLAASAKSVNFSYCGNLIGDLSTFVVQNSTFYLSLSIRCGNEKNTAA